VTDIFSEVEEDVRRERLEKLWKEYSDYIIAGVAFVIIGVAGWQLWHVYEQREALKASQEFMAAEQLLDSGQNAAAAQAYGHLAATAPSGYAMVSRLQEAGALAASGRQDDSLKLYREIASGSDPILSAVARIRIAWQTVETAPAAQIQQTLGPLMDPTNAWNPMAREILAYADYRSGDAKDALTEYKKLATDKNVDGTLSQRASAMVAFLTSGAGADYGTVPPAPIPAAPADAKAPATAPETSAQGAPHK
jgi:hypothetical protein